MIHRPGIAYSDLVTPSNPLERRIFTHLSVRRDGAELYLRNCAGIVRMPDSATAAVLEDLCRIARVELTRLEQAGLSQSGEPDVGMPRSIGGSH
jgi:hypothetical protein